MWYGKDKGYMSVTVKNGIVISKNQAGLKSAVEGGTLEEFDEMNIGITYEQLKEVLGEGEIVSQDNIMSDETTIVYEYTNEDGSNADFEFTGDSLVSKL